MLNSAAKCVVSLNKDVKEAQEPKITTVLSLNYKQ